MASLVHGVFWDEPATDDRAKLVAANTRFAINLYKQQSVQSGGNLFMSPLSVSIALAMTYLGAKGKTLEQMKTVLCFDEVDQNKLHSSFSEIMNALKCLDGGYTLHMANRLFGQKTHKFLDSYLQESKKYYGTELAAINFIGNATGAAAEINGWVAENTNQKIRDLVPASAISDDTRLILVNAIYFKGDWIMKFEKKNTQKAYFAISPTDKVKVQLMCMTEESIKYGSSIDLHCQVIELPYQNHALSMFILLPDKTVTNLKEVESKLTTDHFINIEDQFSMAQRKVNIWLPRFKMDETLQLEEMLSIMGMQDLFTAGVADLSGIDGEFVSSVLHKAYVDVNEEGCEAAAATATMICTFSLVEEDPAIDFKADHPFLFFIRHNVTKSILFLGRLVKP